MTGILSWHSDWDQHLDNPVPHSLGMQFVVDHRHRGCMCMQTRDRDAHVRTSQLALNRGGEIDREPSKQTSFFAVVVVLTEN